MADAACRAVGVVGADCRRKTVVAENEILLVENEWNFGIEDAELFNIIKNGGALIVMLKIGWGAPAGAPASEIGVVTKREIAIQKNNWRPKALAPLGAVIVMNIFILSGCFSDGGHTQTNFLEK